MKDLISVIVPVYRVEGLLPRCVESILAQTYRNLEIILVDDGSPDGCGALCDDYARRDSRVRVIHQKNGGLAAARNAGLSSARGAFLGFVDSDDHIAPDMYETLLNSITAENADIAVCGRYMELESGELVPEFTLEGPAVFDAHEGIRRFLLSDGLDAAAWDKLYRRSLWGGSRYPTEYVSEDVPVTARLLARANRIVHCGRPLYYYFQRAGGLSRAAFSERAKGIYLFAWDVGMEMGRRFPDLEEAARFYGYKALLVLLFRYVSGLAEDPFGWELYGQVKEHRKNICKNQYLKPKYKIFALAACTGLEGAAVRVSRWLGVNESRFIRGRNSNE